MNDFRLSYGYTLTDKLKVGAGVSYLFGSITEREVAATGSFPNVGTLNIEEQNNYSGFRLALGLQYEIAPKLIIGWTMNLPTVLDGKQNRTVAKTLDNAQFPVESDSDVAISSFSLPMDVGTGILFSPIPSLSLNLDYNLKLWNATKQKDDVGDFTDQYIFAVGAELVVDNSSYKYWERINFRAGFNYDTGYLSINENDVDSYTITGGIGFPLGNRTKSMLNISFASTSRGSTQGILVEERLNTVNINLSLKDIWFLQRKID